MIPYLENLTGEKWILLKDKLFFRWPDKKSDVGGAKDGVQGEDSFIKIKIRAKQRPGTIKFVISGSEIVRNCAKNFEIRVLSVLFEKR